MFIVSEGMRVVPGTQDCFHAHCLNPPFVCSALLSDGFLTVYMLRIHSPNPGMVCFSPSTYIPCQCFLFIFAGMKLTFDLAAQVIFNISKMIL